MGYQQLVAIIQEARELDEAEAKKVPVDCPNDGAVLKLGPEGQLFCPADGWQPDYQ